MVSFTDFTLDANECEVFSLRALPIKTISLSVLEQNKIQVNNNGNKNKNGKGK